MKQQTTVAVAQLRPQLGQVSDNVERHIEWVHQARQAGADLVVFPELGLTGYQLQDLTLDVARTLDAPEIQRLVAASHGTDIVFSFVEESADHRFYISAVYASMGEILGVHRKVYLPTYGMFDEARYFAAGSRFEVAEGAVGRVGLLICEDAWHVSSPYLLSLGGADLLILPSSSPARFTHDADTFGSHTFWKGLIQNYAQLFGAYVVFANRVGFEDGVGFFGGSTIVSPSGVFVAEAPVLEEHLLLAALDGSAIRRARYSTPIRRDERPDLVLRELERLIHGNHGGQV